eukprot:318272-Pyramimonas_sp.AAC.1
MFNRSQTVARRLVVSTNESKKVRVSSPATTNLLTREYRRNQTNAPTCPLRTPGATERLWAVSFEGQAGR